MVDSQSIKAPAAEKRGFDAGQKVVGRRRDFVVDTDGSERTAGQQRSRLGTHRFVDHADIPAQERMFHAPQQKAMAAHHKSRRRLPRH